MPVNDQKKTTTEDTTHFGYQQVPWQEKTEKVGHVFHSVARHYDLMNDLMSLGIHRAWKYITIQLACIKKHHVILDLAGGTGDLAKKFSKIIDHRGKVILADINASMLATGREKLLNQGIVSSIAYTQANAEILPFTDNCFDVITIGFGLRNVTDKQQALREIYRVLKPGGQLLILEFSTITSERLKPLYDFYSFKILPSLGHIILKDSDSYRYLAESIRMHPNQEALLQMMENAGFEDNKYHNFCAGIVALHRGYKY